MLFVSHDRSFLRGLANRVLEIGGEDGTGKQSRPPPARPLILRCRSPRCPHPWPPFAGDGPGSFAGCTKSIRSSVPAAAA